MCQPGKYERDNENRCIPVVTGRAACDNKVKCKSGTNMICKDGRCKCPNGYTMTADNLYCKSKNERLVGEFCASGDKCISRRPDSEEYMESSSICIQGVCRCHTGMKPDGVTCTTWDINEEGCLYSTNCHGGAICDKGRCSCSKGYSPYAENTKCIREGSKRRIPIEGECNEAEEESYCQYDLKCVNCMNDLRHTRRHTCARYAHDRAFPASSASSNVLSSLLVCVLYFIARWR
ncbi:DgyrCDS5375 [Dimorphilus gyrociliatus]|nr:DgyrCDS5375 [Dimorphilus gyrociliatus]